MGYQCIYNANGLREDIMQRRCSYLLYNFCKKNGTKICMKQLVVENIWKTIVFRGSWSSRSIVFLIFELIFEGIILKMLIFNINQS